jgi:hypothetical protein
VAGPAPDEESDSAEAERESLSVIGASRLACAPGPIPLSRTAQLLIEAPSCPVAGCLSRAWIFPHDLLAFAEMASPSSRGVASVYEVYGLGAEHPMTGVRVQPLAPARWAVCSAGLERIAGRSGEEDLREVRIDARTGREAWNLAYNGARRGEAATPDPIIGAPHHRVQGA